MSELLKVLVVEDERTLLDAIVKKLATTGFQALPARTVEEALQQVKATEGISAIWLDHYLLGKETGLDFVVELKSMDKYKGIPIFVVSNTATSDKIQSYLDLGVTKYYLKADFRLDQIITDIKEATH